MENVIGTLLFFPVYLALRWTYFHLPVGPDTGYYVSNHTIASGKFNFSKGWNSRYAMCSKFIPEAFCSLIYIWFGHKRYKVFWRLFFSIYNFATAVAIGGIVHLVCNGAPYSFLAGVVTYGLVSSESDYGIYYESAEQFEILFQALGTLFILKGLEPVRPELLVLGAGLWFLDVFFIKITAIAAAAPLLLGSVIYYSPIWKLVLLEFSLFLLAYIALFLSSNKNPLATIRSEAAHQSIYSRTGRDDVTPLQGLVEQLGQKVRHMAKIILMNPVVPFFALSGTFWLAKNGGSIYIIFLFLYFLGISIKLLISFLPIWWYTIPVLPLLGIFGALGLFEVLGSGIYGKIFIALSALAWLTLNVFRVYRKDEKDLVAKAWRMHPVEGQIHLDLETITPDLQNIIQNQSLFVYGYPSLCAMAGQSYDVNFLSGIRYMEEMNPRWQVELHKKMDQEPPAFIFDMFGRFDPHAVKENLGIYYEEIKSWKGGCSLGVYRLYKMSRRENPDEVNLDFRSHQFVPTGTL